MFSLVVFSLIGIAGFIVGYVMRRRAKIAKEVVNKIHYRIAMAIMVASVILFVAVWLSWSLVSVPPGNEGVTILFGAVGDRSLSSGLNLKNPFAQVIMVNNQTLPYTMALESYDVPGKGDSVPVITADGLTVWLDITIYYRIPAGKGPWIIQNRTFHDQKDFEDSYIRPKSRSGLREIIAQLRSEDMYAYKREQVADKLFELLSERFPDDGAECVSVEVRNIDLPPTLKSAIESKLTWQQEAEKMVYVKQKEQMEAERKVIEAGGIAEYQRIVSSTLSPEYLQFKWMDKLSNLNAQTVYYVPTNPATGIPMMKTF